MKKNIIAALIISAVTALNPGLTFAAEKGSAGSLFGNTEWGTLKNYFSKEDDIKPELIPVYPSGGYSYDGRNTFLYPYEKEYKNEYLILK